MCDIGLFHVHGTEGCARDRPQIDLDRQQLPLAVLLPRAGPGIRNHERGYGVFQQVVPSNPTTVESYPSIPTRRILQQSNPTDESYSSQILQQSNPTRRILQQSNPTAVESYPSNPTAVESDRRILQQSNPTRQILQQSNPTAVKSTVKSYSSQILQQSNPTRPILQQLNPTVESYSSQILHVQSYSSRILQQSNPTAVESYS
eukprot:9500526-Pyramimonas_sp.AAC.2